MLHIVKKGIQLAFEVSDLVVLLGKHPELIIPFLFQFHSQPLNLHFAWSMLHHRHFVPLITLLLQVINPLQNHIQLIANIFFIIPIGFSHGFAQVLLENSVHSGLGLLKFVHSVLQLTLLIVQVIDYLLHPFHFV